MTDREPIREQHFQPMGGWTMLLLFLGVEIAGLLTGISLRLWEEPLFLFAYVVVTLIVSVCLAGFFIVNPNQARVLVLFGKYRGSVRTEGFFWTNPFTIKNKLSLRAHNLASEKVKVNDLAGNPIEIGAVVVWQVHDTAMAEFEVEEYYDYVDVQIEAAIRELAKSHPYDENTMHTDLPTLRGSTDEVTKELIEEIQRRLDRAGILVLEARLSHLAYAPEIASAMLQRQQATAVVAAREKIVEGAVGMVHLALQELSEKGILELDDERRATMVSNLMVVLCGHSPATPIVNTGSLYT